MANVGEVYAFLEKNRFGFLATQDPEGARVRPFMFQFEDQGCPLFCTANNKDVFRQLREDPRCEVAFCSPDWAVTLRVRGRAAFFPGEEQKARILEENPSLKEMYGSPDNRIFEVFRLEDWEARFWDFSGTTRVVRP